MTFLLSDTFTDSLAKLTGEEQKAVKTTAFDLQMNPANPGMKLHRLDETKGKNFWSVRVSRDLRLIVHRSASSLLLCYEEIYNTERNLLYVACTRARDHLLVTAVDPASEYLEDF